MDRPLPHDFGTNSARQGSVKAHRGPSPVRQRQSVSYYARQDHAARRAREESYSARSVFKLQELDHRYMLLKPGMCVLDLGCAPGSWLEYAAPKVGSRGFCLGVDLVPVQQELPNTRFEQGDALDPALLSRLASEHGIRYFDLVLCDMSPRLTGIRAQDQERALALWTAALDTARAWLRPDGALVVKLFEGGGHTELIQRAKQLFTRVELMRPKTTRKHSREIYLVGLGKL